MTKPAAAPQPKSSPANSTGSLSTLQKFDKLPNSPKNETQKTLATAAETPASPVEEPTPAKKHLTVLEKYALAKAKELQEAQDDKRDQLIDLERNLVASSLIRKEQNKKIMKSHGLFAAMEQAVEDDDHNKEEARVALDLVNAAQGAESLDDDNLVALNNKASSKKA